MRFLIRHDSWGLVQSFPSYTSEHGRRRLGAFAVCPNQSMAQRNALKVGVQQPPPALSCFLLNDLLNESYAVLVFDDLKDRRVHENVHITMMDR